MIENIAFDPPETERPDILIIAGEHSGDQHAAQMVKKIKSKRPELYICALGGPELEASGAHLLRDLTEHSVVGFIEVMRDYSFFELLFSATTDWIRIYRPRVVVFVDYPGFNLRIIDRLFKKGTPIKAGGTLKFYYYISPQIWAWKAKRRFQMAEQLDALGVIFPFEVDCYKDTDLDVKFLGHPFVDQDYELPVAYDATGPVLLLPGSRKSSVARIFPVMLRAFEKLLETRPNETAVVIYPSNTVLKVLEMKLAKFPHLESKIRLVMERNVVGAKAVLTSSGTMSLKCALAGIPGAIVYRANIITYIIGRTLVKIPYLGIANILLKRAMYPEFIQGAANYKILANELISSINDEDRLKTIQKDAEELKQLLKGRNTMASYEWVIDALKDKPKDFYSLI